MCFRFGAVRVFVSLVRVLDRALGVFVHLIENLCRSWINRALRAFSDFSAISKKV